MITNPEVGTRILDIRIFGAAAKSYPMLKVTRGMVWPVADPGGGPGGPGARVPPGPQI